MRRPTPDATIRWCAAGAVLVVATVAAYISYRHAYELATRNGETIGTAAGWPLTVDGLIFAASMVLLQSARRGVRGWRELWLAYLMLAAGIAATVGANVAHGLDHGRIGAAVAAWPALALVGSYELLMWIVRTSPQPADGATSCQCGEGGADVVPVARTLVDAAVSAVRDGMSQRDAETEFGVPRKKISAALNQAKAVAPEVAQIRTDDERVTA